MPTKCSKCGADITDEAAFCPGCGAPKPAEQPAPEPAPEPQPKATPPPAPAPKPAKPIKTGSGLKGLFDMIFSKTALILGIGLGILFVMIGAIIMGFNTYGILAAVGFVLSSLGYGGVSFLLICAGIYRKDYDKYVRAAMVGTGGFVLAWSLSIIGAMIQVLASQSYRGF